MDNTYIYYKIKAYLELNNSGSIDTNDESKLQIFDDGSGPYIKTWNINLPEPTSDDLDASANIEKATTLYSSSMYVRNRRINYPTLGEQFDMLYHELDSSGSLSVTGNWFQTLKNVKNSYPKS